VKIIALDYGSARTGVAVSDPTGTLARPVGVIERVGTKAGLERLVELIRSEGADRVVVGLPLTLRASPPTSPSSTRDALICLPMLAPPPIC
jgi:putative Holliday junction resolvase